MNRLRLRRTRNKREIMATPSLRLPENVPGAFYVTNECVDCDLCRSAAPSVFRRDEASGYSVVFKQPENESEVRLAMEGLEGCPTEAIGKEP